MGIRAKAISGEVLEALRSVEWDGELALLTCGQLERKAYVATNDVLESLGGKWNKKRKGHLFENAAHDALEAVIETGEYSSAVDAKQFFGFFETPDKLADELVQLLNYSVNGGAILEPSAGSGQLVRAIRRRHGFNPWVSAVEIQGKFHDDLEVGTRADGVHIADFLTVRPPLDIDGGFNCVAMNPPFARQADIDHVLHAWKFLAPGGRLVSIMSPGWTFRTNRKSTEFIAFVREHGRYFDNYPGAFKASGTNFNSVMVVLERRADHT